MTRRGELHRVIDTMVVQAAQTILGGCAVWADNEAKAVDDSAAGQTTLAAGVALYDGTPGEALTVVKEGITQVRATDAETIEAGDLVKINGTTGRFELADITSEDAHGRAWSPTTGGNGEYFECELFPIPLRAEP